MKIAVVGTGYVGLVAGVCFASAGHNVVCVDNDQNKINLLNQGKIPIYEPGLEELTRESRARLEFTTDLNKAVRDSSVIFVAVGTPEKADGSADLGPTLQVVEAICKAAQGRKFLVMKSTVPIGTARKLKELIPTFTTHPIEIVSNPEFLKEGAALEDFLKPDRVVIGCESEEAQSAMAELYEPFVRNGNPIIVMDNASAEMTKYAANAFLSVKISFINELALLADQLGADINAVRKGFTSDKRINPAFFHPGVGFGGSCFPKDVKALVHTGKEAGVAMQVVEAADLANDRQKHVLVHRMKKHFGNLQGKTIALWGLAFKPRTDDVREAPSLEIIAEIVKAGGRVQAYDPVAADAAKKASRAPFEIAPTALAALKGADALAIITEWNEFRAPDLNEVKAALKSPVIFDGRNVLDPAKATQAGFAYYCIGRQNMAQNNLPK